MDGLTQVAWRFPDQVVVEHSSNDSSSSDDEDDREEEQQQPEHSPEAVQGLLLAQSTARDFEMAFQIRSPERERTVPTFDGDEVVISAEPTRYGAYTEEHELLTVRLIMDLHKGSFGGNSDKLRIRFSERSIDGHYAIKYLQRGIVNTDHAANATSEMVLETRILMNLTPHPNICQCYGINSAGIDSLLEPGRKGFFLITDAIAETLAERIQKWRQQMNKGGHDGEEDSSQRRQKLGERLEVATDIASALEYLHDRKLVFYLRPDKVGFDTRYGRIKLCEFGQCRQVGMKNNPRSLTKSDDIRSLAYTAPEVLCKGVATTATDIYAFGMLLFELMSLKQPFEGWSRALHFQRVVRQHERPRLATKNQQDWPKSVCRVVEDCWDPHHRPTIKVAHEGLETALLFQDEETEQAREFLAVRRNSNSEDEVYQASESRFNTHDTQSPMCASPPARPSRRNLATPSSSKRKKKDHNKSGRNLSLKVASSKLEELEAIVAERARNAGEATPSKKSRPRRIKVRSGSTDKGEEGAAQLLSKLGMQLHEDGSVETCDSSESGSGSFPAPRSPRHPRRHSHDGHSLGSHSQEPTAPKTPRRRRASHDGSQIVEDPQQSTPGEPKTPRRAPRRTRSTSSVSRPKTPSRQPKTPKTPGRLKSSNTNRTSSDPYSSPRKSPQKTPRRKSSSPRTAGGIHRSNSEPGKTPHSPTKSPSKSPPTRVAATGGGPPKRRSPRGKFGGLQRSKSVDSFEPPLFARDGGNQAGVIASPQKRPNLDRFGGMSRRRSTSGMFASQVDLQVDEEFLAELVGNLHFKPTPKATPAAS